MIASRTAGGPPSYVEGIATRANNLGCTQKLELSDTVVVFLHIEATVLSSGSFPCAQYVTPGFMNNTPLDSRSQPYHVHKTWPAAALTRGVALGSSPQVVATRIAPRCLRHCMPAPELIIRAAPSNQLPKKPTVAASMSSVSSAAIARCSWVSMSYHAIMAQPHPLAGKELSDDAEWKQLHRRVFNKEAPLMRCAWKDSGKHHELFVRRTTATRRLSELSSADVADPCEAKANGSTLFSPAAAGGRG